MNTKNFIITVLGLGVLVGLGVMIYNSDYRPDYTNQEQYNSENPYEEIPYNPENPSGYVEGANAPFDKVIVLESGGQAVFTDGLTLKLKEINDSRCKPGVQCIWQGEISGTFTVSGGKISGTKEFFLGTERNKSVVLNDYTFTLTNAMPTELWISVSYKKTVSGGPCYVGGCSGHICSGEKDIMSTCEWREEYACYRRAKCERQSNGQCGWTSTAQLQACLNSF